MIKNNSKSSKPGSRKQEEWDDPMVRAVRKLQGITNKSIQSTTKPGRKNTTRPAKSHATPPKRDNSTYLTTMKHNVKGSKGSKRK